MSYRRIKWIAVLLPAAVLGAWESFRHYTLEPLLPRWIGNLLSTIVVMLGAYFFIRVLVRMIEQAVGEAARAQEEAVVMRERQRIAREMHDGVAQTLFYVHVKLSDLAKEYDQGDTASFKNRLASVQIHLEEAYRRVRQAIMDLRQQEDQEPFEASLRNLILQFANQSMLRPHLQVYGEGHVSDGARTHLLAIVQEALINADKHSGAREAQVTADFRSGRLHLVVADQGCGFTHANVRSGSHGLMIMQERASLAGADFKIETEQGLGTRIVLQMQEAS